MQLPIQTRLQAAPPRRVPALADRVLALALAALAAAGCGKNPAKPIVVLPPLSAVILNVSVDTVQVGQTVQLTATALDTTGTPVAGASFAWKSTNVAVFTVNSNGRVSGMGEGTALLIASAGGLSDSAAITVFPQTGWIMQVSNTTSNLNGVFFQPDGRTGWAVGDGGRILKTSNAGVTWAIQVSNTAFNLNGVWFTAPDTGWAVGNAGTVLRTVNGGAIWTRIPSNAGENLMDVQFATRDTGWAVGAGVIVRTFNRGATWQRLTPTVSTLRSVSFSGTREAWAVGDGGVIVGTHDRGLSWFIVQPAITGQALKAVWRRSEPVAFAVGAGGVAPRTISPPADTTKWELMNAGAVNQLEGVHYPTDLIGYAVGFNASGLVLRTDDGGQTWQTQDPSTQFRLNDVYFLDAIHGWAVGNNGTIVHTATGGLP